jgi:hypothetical protein
VSPSLPPTLGRLNEYLQADKANEINVETLYGDLQRRFSELKADWSRADAERVAMRKALRAAQAQTSEMAEANKRLTALLEEVRIEQARMARAKKTVLRALELEDDNSTKAA